MAIKVIPALDFIDRKIVRLSQGKFDQVQYFDQSIYDYLDLFKRLNASRVHIVNLLAAKGEPMDLNFLEELSRFKGPPIQYGGGLKDIEIINKISSLFNKLVISSIFDKSYQDLELFLESINTNTVIAALDFKLDADQEPQFMTKGWTERSDHKFWDLLQFLFHQGINDFILTDISRDGMMMGPNFNFYEEIRQKFPDGIIYASGGVSNIHDIETLNSIGVDYVIVGKALLMDEINIKEIAPYLQEE